MVNNVIAMCGDGGEIIYKVDQISFFQFAKNLTGKKSDVFYYMLKNMDKRTNIFYGTGLSISNALNISRPTVTKALRYLQEKGVIKPKQLGVWELDLAKIA